MKQGIDVKIADTEFKERCKSCYTILTSFVYILNFTIANLSEISWNLLSHYHTMWIINMHISHSILLTKTMLKIFWLFVHILEKPLNDLNLVRMFQSLQLPTWHLINLVKVLQTPFITWNCRFQHKHNFKKTPSKWWNHL